MLIDEYQAEIDKRDAERKLHLSDVRERLINHINTRINYFSGGEEMKSISESVTDSFIVKELESLKKIINENTF